MVYEWNLNCHAEPVEARAMQKGGDLNIKEEAYLYQKIEKW